MTPVADGWRRLRRDRTAVVCGGLIAAVALLCFVGPALLGALAGIDATTQDVLLGAAPPSWRHPLGTDALGRDLLVRTLDGGAIAIRVGLGATCVAVALGVVWGAVAGWAGGRIDEVMMRVVDVLYALPSTVFVIVVMALVASRDELLLFGLIGATSWLTMARIVRAQVLGLRRREFVEAARGLGVPPATIVRRHILPNALGPIIVYATLLVPGVMLQEAFLSFLGLGVPAPRASWGTLIADGSRLLVVYPWTLAGPGALMAVTIFALNFLGDGLRDAFDVTYYTAPGRRSRTGSSAT
jgi:oligopeptide transport system permease protein